MCFFTPTWADSIILLYNDQNLQKKDSIAQEINQTQKQAEQHESEQTFMHPLLQGLRTLSRLHKDNFIALDSQSKDSNKSPQQPTLNENNAQDLKPSAISPTKNQTPKPILNKKNKPKVLLIMDDLAKQEQLKQLFALPLHITPSIFPKTKQTPHTPILGKLSHAQNRIFMIHLPLEAKHYPQKLLAPLPKGSSKDSIKQRLMEIKYDFPHLTYLNNHTGSAFTQNLEDMQNLLSVFDELGLKFIDSVTTPKPASSQIAKQQGRLIMARDIFLDNEQSVDYIKKQLASLVRKAYKKGYAIAICHPHSSTFEALKQMSNELNDSLDLVSPQELESYLQTQGKTQYVRSSFFE